MPTKRQLLTQLNRVELTGALDGLEMEIADRRSRDKQIEALATSKRARIHDILLNLPRVRLQTICYELGIDDSGTRKTELVDKQGL